MYIFSKGYKESDDLLFIKNKGWGIEKRTLQKCTQGCYKVYTLVVNDLEWQTARSENEKHNLWVHQKEDGHELW